MPLKFNASVIRFELPIDLHFKIVTVFLPGSDFRCEGFLVSYPAICTPTTKYAQLNFNHVLACNAIQIVVLIVWLQSGLIASRRQMRVEIVRDQHNLFHIRIFIVR